MSNDPKDAVVDMTKLVRSQTPAPEPTPVVPNGTTANMITSCNEGVNMIGHENFSLDDDTKKQKPE